jgi:hypothetical protein
LLNFLEEVAISVDAGVADEGVLNRFLGYILPRTFFDYKYWIELFRKKESAPDTYLELERLATRWKTEYGGD